MSHLVSWNSSSCLLYITHTNKQLQSAWEWGPLHFLGPHPAFALALQLSTSFTWECALVRRKSTQWHFPQCHIYRPLHRAGGTIGQSDTVRPQPRRQSSIVVQEEDRGNNNQSPWLSDFSSSLYCCSIQLGPSSTLPPIGPPQGNYSKDGAHRKKRQSGRIENGTCGSSG